MIPSRRVLGTVITFATTALALVAVAGPAHAASLRVSQTTGLDPGGQSVTVSGSGFDPDKNNGFGVYVVYGPRRADFHRNANAFASAVWVHRGGGGGGGQARMSPSGTFTVTLTVKAKYTDGDGRAVDCVKTRCNVMTMAAHGVPDRSQDVVIPMMFKGAGGSSGSGGSGSGGSGSGGNGTGGSSNAAPGTTASGGATGTAAPSAGASGPPQVSPAGSATPLAVEPFRQTAAGEPAQSPWPFWLAVGAVIAAALTVRRLAARRTPRS